MSDHEGNLKRHAENSFITLHEKIGALKECMNVIINEREKFRKQDYDKLAKELDMAEAECKECCETYIKHLEDNVKMYRKG